MALCRACASMYPLPRVRLQETHPSSGGGCGGVLRRVRVGGCRCAGEDAAAGAAAGLQLFTNNWGAICSCLLRMGGNLQLFTKNGGQSTIVY